MNLEGSSISIALPVFDGQNYHLWAVRMEAYFDASDLWEAVEQEYEIPTLPNNPTMAQIRNHKEKKQRKSKARATLFASEYEGNEKVKGMQVLNLIREFEMQRMKESETIQEYSNRLLGIVNNVRLLGTDFSDSRIVQKILVTIPEKFEATIASLENSKDMSSISLAELLNALQAQEQRRKTRQEDEVQGAFHIKTQNSEGGKDKNNNKWKSERGEGSNKQQYETFPPCPHCKKNKSPSKKMLVEARCRV
ncbi:uncharacterized protein LOC133316757 [Gastrolobium bilobum]|uniref:uncharacterized protein LOC133316757 n=1 Tax=Gastrolobium bilobum TaxID=150636 RepID=UPI002AB1CBF3|nr:uncharacterized protein LOC133316757 [Gastrolobium bilobum]